jgi:outer membrane protein OmpA-like peptidoglycan-associated protein/tetratricopeptide (TPR) repeat protein
MKKTIFFLLCTWMLGSVEVLAQNTSQKSNSKKKSTATTPSVAPASAVQPISANNNNPAIARGDRLFKKFAFPAAVEEYKAALNKDENNIEAKEKLARTYIILNDYASAEPLLESLAKLQNAKANNKLLYGLALRANKKYKEADAVFNEYALLNPSDPRAAELANGLSAVEELLKDNGTHVIEPAVAENSDASDFGVSYYRDNSIIFSSNRGTSAFVGRVDSWTERKYYDLFVSNGGKVTSLSKSKVINRKYHEGPATFTKDFSEMIFTRSNILKKVGKSKDGIVKLKLYSSKYDSVKGKWSKPTELPFNSSEYSVAHPSLSKDGKRLYFISDMPGGYGETDIYVSFKEASGWGPPMNLGNKVNTPGREMFPFISQDGTLFFSSDSRTGLGGLDIYSASFSNGEWGNVMNLGAPVNSEADDFNYVLDESGKLGYFVSNRIGGKGDDDIYKLQRKGVKICGTVVDAETNLPIQDAKVNMMLVDKIIASKKTDEKGNFCFTADPGKEYKFEASKEKYETNSANIKVALSNPNFAIPLSPAKEKPPVAADNTAKWPDIDPSKGITLIVCAKERGKGNMAEANVEVQIKETGARKTCLTGKDCKCKFVIESNKEYFISVSKDGYSTATKTINTKGEKPGTTKLVELTLDQLRQGLTVRLENIYYDLDKWNIRPDAAKELDNLVDILKKYPNMEIELSSHTDSRASDQYNLILSARRAKACVDYLKNKGIDIRRLLAVGYGETKLTNKCANGVKCSEAEHQRNRRTEFKILKME